MYLDSVSVEMSRNPVVQSDVFKKSKTDFFWNIARGLTVHLKCFGMLTYYENDTYIYDVFRKSIAFKQTPLEIYSALITCGHAQWA